MNVWLILFFFLLCCGIAYYIYNITRKDPNAFIPNEEYKQIGQTTQGDVKLFYVSWCPYSQTTLTTWNIIKSKYSNPKYTINFSEVDCEQNSTIASEYNITEYPTIILTKNSLNYEYDASLSSDTFELFINTVMKN